jgi:hypothetical protein
MSGVKPNTIKLILRKKIKEWVDTITDPEVAKAIEENAMMWPARKRLTHYYW